jgi:hypothetical protein
MSWWDKFFAKQWNGTNALDPAGHKLIEAIVGNDSHVLNTTTGHLSGLFGGNKTLVGHWFNDIHNEAGRNEANPVRGVGRGALTAAAVLGAMYGAPAAAGAGGGDAAAGDAAGTAVGDGAAAGGGGVATDAMGGAEGTLGAADSSAASSQLGYSAADVSGGVPSSVNVDGTTYKTAGMRYMPQMRQFMQGYQPQPADFWNPSQDNRPSSAQLSGNAPAYAPIASQPQRPGALPYSNDPFSAYRSPYTGPGNPFSGYANPSAVGLMGG